MLVYQRVYPLHIDRFIFQASRCFSPFGGVDPPLPPALQIADDLRDLPGPPGAGNWLRCRGQKWSKPCYILLPSRCPKSQPRSMDVTFPQNMETQRVLTCFDPSPCVVSTSNMPQIQTKTPCFRVNHPYIHRPNFHIHRTSHVLCVAKCLGSCAGITGLGMAQWPDQLSPSSAIDQLGLSLDSEV